MKPTTFKELTEQYLSNPDVTSLSASSINRYTALSNTLAELHNPELDYTSNPMQAASNATVWFNKLTETSVSNDRVNDHRKHIKRVYTWGTRNFGVAYDSNPGLYMKALKHEKKEHNPFTDQDIKDLVDFPLKSRYNKYSDSEKVIVNTIIFLYETGMRPQELSNLNVNDIIYDDNETDKLIAIKGAKGREAGKVSRYLFVTPKVQECIDKALEVKRSAGSTTPKLFVNARGTDLNMVYFRKIFKALLNRINMPEKTLYDCRRGCATNIIHNPRYGAVVAQKQLGHKHLSTTMIYENLDKKSAARLFRGFN